MNIDINTSNVNITAETILTPFAIATKPLIVSSLLCILSILSIFLISSCTWELSFKSVNVTKYEALNGFDSSQPAIKACLSFNFSLVWFNASSLDTNVTLFTPSIACICSPICSIWASVAVFWIKTWIPCCVSNVSTALFRFSIIMKNKPKINIVAHIIASDAPDDFLLWNTFLKPSPNK